MSSSVEVAGRVASTTVVCDELPSRRPTNSDWLGIYTTQLNAQLVRLIFGKEAHPTIAADSQAFDPASWKKSILVAGGHKPGGSSDTNMIKLAKRFGAKLAINISNVDYLYTKDPREFKNAQKICEITWKDYRKMMGGKWIRE